MRRYLYKALLLAFAIIAIIVLSASCSRDAEGPVLVEIDGHKIYADQFYNSVPEDVWKYMTEDEKRTYLNQYINKELVVQDVRNRQLTNSPAVKAQLNAAISDVLGQVFLDAIINPRIEIEQDEIKQYYRQNQAYFARDDEEVWLYQLILHDEEYADSAYLEIDAVDDSLKLDVFREIAQRHSLDTTGIDMGFVPRNSIISDVRSRINRATPGTLLKPIKTSFGYLIIYYKDIGRRGTLHRIESVESEIENIIFRRKQNELQRALIDSLREYHKPIINQTVLDSLLIIKKDL